MMTRWWMSVRRRAVALGGPPRKTNYEHPVTRPSALLMRVAALVASLVSAQSAIAQGERPADATSSRPAQRLSAGTPLRVAPGDFPHAKHVRLFPTCEGCHADVTGPTSDLLFPSPASCATCHNGTDVRRVLWTPPARPATPALLDFSHQRHFAKSDSATRQCTTCHATPGRNQFMEVSGAASATCFGCHQHQATSHYDPANSCRTCHRPLVEARRLDLDAVRALPRPPTHLQPTFGATHAPLTPAAAATCATCHARESCARCHLNVSTLPVASGLASDARVAAVTRNLLPSWPTPDTHRRDGFVDRHGTLASAVGASCANCHARSSCTTCHTGAGASAVIRTLPEPSRGPRGVQLRRAPTDARGHATTTVASLRLAADTTARIVRPHPRNFIDAHRSVAAAGQQTCAGCHTQRFCSDCHAGESKRAFHPANFVAGHAAPTYARDRECASCHNTEVFCRDCHRASGLQAAGRNAAVYHNAQPQWLLQHGRAARLELTSCTTCHTQATCMRCHATTGWGVNPHGRDFDADRLGKKAMAMCARCHITDPRRGR